MIPKAGHRLVLGMKSQKEVMSNQKQPSCKKGCSLQKRQGEKRCEKTIVGLEEVAMLCPL